MGINLAESVSLKYLGKDFIANYDSYGIHIRNSEQMSRPFNVCQADEILTLSWKDKATLESNFTEIAGENDNLTTEINEMCNTLLQLSSRGAPFSHVINASILPFFLALTVVINILLCITLTRPNMRTPTNFILLAISIADLFTGLLPLPIYTAFNTNYFDTDITCTKGYLVHYFSVCLPTIFHTISIWLTVLLALQRFVYVVRPLEVHKYAICRYQGVAISIAIIIILALILYANTFVTFFKSGSVICKNEQGLVTNIERRVFKCTPLPRSIQFPLLLLRSFSVHIIPCLLLCVLTSYMMAALRNIAKKRNELLKQKKEMQMLTEALRSKNEGNNGKKNASNRSREAASNGDAYKTSRIMLVVLILFLVVETPNTILVSMYTIMVMLKVEQLSHFNEVREICNLLIVFSYPCNFLIYFAKSKQFRSTFASLLPRCSK